MTAGNANTIIPAKISMVQANIGSLSSDMPGARVRRHADDDLDRAGDRRDLDETDAEQPEVGAHAGRELRAGQRRVHEPAAVRRQVEEQCAEEHSAADEIGPEREGAEPRKRLIACAEHLRQQQDAHRLDHRHGEQEHHHRAVHGEDLVVSFLAEEGVAWHRELQPHQQCKDARQRKNRNAVAT